MSRATDRAIRKAFDPNRLAQLCRKDEQNFGDVGTKLVVPKDPEKFVWYKDNGSDILFVAHLDSVQDDRWCRTVYTPRGPVVTSPVLDDRLGVYVGLDLLPKLGVETDILLTTNEETGSTTAKNFITDKKYNWIFSFDRAGTDVVLYDYEDFATRELVKDTGATIGRGSFSCIAALERLGCKGVNWGVGYQNYHSSRAYAWMEDTFEMVGYFLKFYKDNKDKHLEHTEKSYSTSSSIGESWHGYGSGYDHTFGYAKGRVWDKEKRRYVDPEPDPDKNHESAPTHYPKSGPTNIQVYTPSDLYDSLDDQVHLLEKELRTHLEKEDSEVLVDLPAPRKAGKKKNRTTSAIKSDIASIYGLPVDCPVCATTLRAGWCPGCKEDWWEALGAHFQEHRI